MTGWLVVDYETASFADLKKVGAWVYSEDVTTEVLCAVLRDHGGGGHIWCPGDCVPVVWLRALREGWTFIAHNVGFEKAITRNVLVPQHGWPDVPNEQWHDTAASCAMRGLPHALGPACLVLRLPVAKNEDESKFTISLSKPNKKGWLDRSPESLQRVVDYCAEDVDAEVELHNRLGFLPPDEHRMWQHDQSMNERGIGIDLDLVRAAQRVVDGATIPLIKEFQDLTGIEKLGSPKLKDWLHAQGVHLDNLQAETVAAALGDDEDDETVLTNEFRDSPPFRALRIRQLTNSASVKKLKAMQRCACEDGRARGMFKWHGTGPGRGAGTLLQPQNFPRGTVEMDGKKVPIDLLVGALMTGDHEFVEMVVGPAVATVATSLRHMLRAAPGKTFIAGDYTGIQARTVLALAGQHDKTALMAQGLNIYCVMGESIHGYHVDKYINLREYQDGKNTILGCGFQMGARRFHQKYCPKQPFSFAEKQVGAYRTDFAPEVVKLWYGLQEAATRTVWDRTTNEYRGIEYRLEDGWLTARSPAGTKIWYRNPQKTKRAMPWDENDIRPGFSFNAWKNKQWVSVDAFGGLLSENIVMRIEVDIKNAGICNLEAAGFPIVLDVHDELVAELANPDEKAFEQCMLDLPAWVKSCQIPIAIDKPWVDVRYRK